MLISETPRLLVRQLHADDLDVLSRITSDPKVMCTVGNGQPLTREQTEAWIHKSLQNYETLGYGTYAAILKASGALIGWGGFVKIEDEGYVELIYGLAQDFWGMGFATELATELLKYGFDELKFDRVVATVDPQNDASVRILTNLGMTFMREGVDEHGLPTAWYDITKLNR